MAKTLAVFIGDSGAVNAMDISSVGNPQAVDAALGRRNWYGLSGENKEAVELIEFIQREQLKGRRNPRPGRAADPA